MADTPGRCSRFDLPTFAGPEASTLPMPREIETTIDVEFNVHGPGRVRVRAVSPEAAAVAMPLVSRDSLVIELADGGLVVVSVVGPPE